MHTIAITLLGQLYGSSLSLRMNRPPLVERHPAFVFHSFHPPFLVLRFFFSSCLPILFYRREACFQCFGQPLLLSFLLSFDSVVVELIPEGVGGIATASCILLKFREEAIFRVSHSHDQRSRTRFAVDSGEVWLTGFCQLFRGGPASTPILVPGRCDF